MQIDFGVFIPQGWKMELASIADPVEKWAKAVEIAVDAEEVGPLPLSEAADLLAEEAGS